MINDASKRKKNPNSAPRPRRAAPQSQKMIRPFANESAVPDGKFRYWCSACMESFLGDEHPTQCANGHRVDDEELNGTHAVMAD